MIRFIAIALLAMPSICFAQSLQFPSNANLTSEVATALDSHSFPMGPWADGAVPVQSAEGALTKQAWRVETASLTSLQLMRPLREQLRNDRYQIVFECAEASCGGFDFRFALDVLPPPEMQVAMNDFRFLTARKQDAPEELVSLLVSRTAQAGYVQVTRVAPVDAAPIAIASAVTEPDFSASDIATQLQNSGRAVLSDLRFETGSAQLSTSDFASLQELAAFLQEDSSRRIVLVGHTDASGDLAPNIALSQRRAASVLERLVTEYALSRNQLAAEGVGFLVPLGPNTTEEGRTLNRRVEVVLDLAPN